MRKTSWRVATALALGLVLPACQRGVCLEHSTMMCLPPPPTPTPTRPVDPVTQGTAPLARDGVAAVPLEVRDRGSLSVVVDWTFPSNTVEVYVARGSCTGRCDVIVIANNPSAKPKRLVVATDAGPYTLLVRNLGPGDESIAFDVNLTR